MCLVKRPSLCLIPANNLSTCATVLLLTPSAAAGLLFGYVLSSPHTAHTSPLATQGKLTSYSPQTGKFTIRYEDGNSEAVLLERERFQWVSPRAASAGYKPALHSLMQQLGADGVAKAPQAGEDGKVVPETAGPEVGMVSSLRLLVFMLI
jgi:hypothetical protein